MAQKNRWFEWDAVNEKWSYRQTEEYVFGKPHGFTKRIGDMNREELIHVIATMSYDRDLLAVALTTAVHGACSGEEVNAEDMGIESEYRWAQRIEAALTSEVAS